jgi:hypothetical protein
MSDYDNQSEHEYFDDGDEDAYNEDNDNLPDLEYNNDINNINNNPQVQQDPQANQVQQAHLQKIQEFVGTIGGKNGWIKCMYCDRYHPNSMHLPNISYCGHCWGWLNSHQLNLTNGTYNGENSITEIKNFLKQTFKLHDPTKCTSPECIYNRIITLEKSKQLHYDFCVELGFIKKEEPKKNLNEPKQSKLNKSKSNIRINYKLSSITI